MNGLSAFFRSAPVRMWALIGAGMALTATGIWQTWIIWKGGWPIALRGKQLELLGWGSLANWALLAIVVVSLAAVKAKATGLGGTSIELDGDHDEPQQTVTATVSATVEKAT